MANSPVLFNSGWTQVVSGVVSYNNTAATPLNGVNVKLYSQAGDLINSSVTNAAGEYSIRVLDGIYVIKPQGASSAWGGVNIIDGLKIRQALVGQVTFTSLQSKAANVDVSATLNIIDYVTLRQKIAGLNPVAWLIANYVFENPTVNISGAGATQNIKSLCGGDVDGSFNPTEPEAVQIVPVNEPLPINE
jgi:hypothetical protein